MMPKPRVDVLLHLRLSDDATGAATERDALFQLDDAIDNRFGEEYDGDDIGEGKPWCTWCLTEILTNSLRRSYR
jgi:hypothetical protein